MLARAPEIAEAHAAGRAAWPSVEVPLEAFAAYIQARLPEGVPVEQALSAMHLRDLYLACACTTGCAPAIEAFERELLAQVPSFVSRLGLPDVLVGELRQSLSERLFVGAGGAAPKVREYGGSGPLAGWLRVVAIRAGLSMRRGLRDHRPVEEAEAVACAVDPELEAIKVESRAVFQEALREAFGALPMRTRTLLRLHYVDGMTGDALAKMYDVHRVTVSRWLVDARSEIREAMTRSLRERLRMMPEDLSPLLSLIRSRLDVSLKTLLGDHSP